jgi:hypothetical protein
MHRRLFTWRNALLGGAAAFALLGVGATGYMGMRTLGIGAPGTLLAQGVLEALLHAGPGNASMAAKWVQNEDLQTGRAMETGCGRRPEAGRSSVTPGAAPWPGPPRPRAGPAANSPVPRRPEASRRRCRR